MKKKISSASTARLRGLTVDELDAVVGAVKNGWVTTTTSATGPDHKSFTTTTSSEPFGQFKKA
jgi:Type-A lantibiotic